MALQSAAVNNVCFNVKLCRPIIMSFYFVNCIFLCYALCKINYALAWVIISPCLIR